MADGRRKTPIEREVKLSASAGFSLPSLEGLGEGVSGEPLPVRDLDATYYDTADLRLARWGVTMRFRSGEGATGLRGPNAATGLRGPNAATGLRGPNAATGLRGPNAVTGLRGPNAVTGTWTVKLPDGEDGPALVRREVPVAGPEGDPPAGALDLVRAYVRNTPLVPVIRLLTRRQGVALRDGEGHLLAEVVDDEVTVIEQEQVADRFREVEVEIDDRAPDGLLTEIVARLRSAGAGAPDPTPKAVRALGARALAPPEVVTPEVGAKPAAGDVVRAAIASSVARVLVHDAGVRLGDDPEDVHQARVGTRRLRSDLRTFRPLLDQDWAEPLRHDLSWFAELLGGVRDADVLSERLRVQAAELPEVDAAGFAPVLLRLADEREIARARLLEAMSSPRYVGLLDRLVQAALDPVLIAKAARRPARTALPPLVARSWRKLRTAVKGLAPVPADEELHRVRILAKRARYAAEAVAPAAGRAKQAKAFVAAAAEVQRVLGDHHDAIVAEEWLRKAVTGADVEQALALGELVAAERAKAAQCRKQWRSAWKKADRKQLRSWLA